MLLIVPGSLVSADIRKSLCVASSPLPRLRSTPPEVYPSLAEEASRTGEGYPCPEGILGGKEGNLAGAGIRAQQVPRLSGWVGFERIGAAASSHAPWGDPALTPAVSLAC